MLALLPTAPTSSLSEIVVGLNYWATAQPTLFTAIELFIGITFALGALKIIIKFFKK